MLHKLSKMLISLFSLQLQKCIQLDEKLKEMDREIAVNPQFVQKVKITTVQIHIKNTKNKT